MDGMRFTVAVHLHGTLAANAQGGFALPCGATLMEVSTFASNDSDAILDVGPTADPDGVIDGVTIGDAAVKRITQTLFNGVLADARNPVHFAAGTVIQWLLDFDGAGGTAAQDVSLVFTFLEG
jgi:hypothetical protein